jgi:hypothetical protein
MPVSIRRQRSRQGGTPPAMMVGVNPLLYHEGGMTVVIWLANRSDPRTRFASHRRGRGARLERGEHRRIRCEAPARRGWSGILVHGIVPLNGLTGRVLYGGASTAILLGLVETERGGTIRFGPAGVLMGMHHMRLILSI